MSDRTVPVRVDRELLERAAKLWPWLLERTPSERRLHVRDGSDAGALDLILRDVLPRMERRARRDGAATDDR